METVNITNIINNLHLKYKDLYHQWRLDNPGHVMCNYGTKEVACKRLVDDKIDTLEKLTAHLEFAKDRAKFYNDQKQMHGWYQAQLVINEILEEIQNKNTKIYV